MKNKIKWLIVSGILVVLINIAPCVVKAQVPPVGDPDAPIDGGVSLLIAAGIGYGIKKNRESKNKKENQED